jgi:Mn2+/Fe2+ NRAMP family transporter
MNFTSLLFYKYRRFVKTMQIFAMVLGPGIIVMVADNDAGGITTYAVTGAKFAYSFIWFEFLLLPVAYVCQEMTVRLGAVTKRGHAEAIFDAFGSFWGWFSLTDLTLTDWLTTVTEFIGMTAALSIFNIPPPLTVLGAIIVTMAMVLSGRYWTWEKIVLAFCVLNLIYIPAAILVNPPLPAILREGVIPGFPYGLTNDVFFFLMANVGTTIAPWMIFFQQSAVVDKGLKERDIHWERLDTAIGSCFTIAVGVFIIIVTATLIPGVNVQSAAEAAVKLLPIHPTVGTLMVIGLFDAGLLGAICISLTSSWAFGEVFGWAHSLNQRIGQAPWFFLFRLVILVTAGTVVLIPGAPLILITLFVQVIAVTLLPAALVFLILLLNQDDLVGKYKNTRLLNVIGSVIVGGIIVLSTLFGISALFPEFFR